jgi:hypothetical protein
VTHDDNLAPGAGEVKTIRTFLSMSMSIWEKAKDWLDRLRRPPPPVDDAAALAVFIDERAAFLVQKGIYEYARARAGHYAKVLFREPEFLAAVEQARWQAYPLGLAMVGELVEGMLRAEAGEDRDAVLAGLTAVVLGVFDRYPLPAPISAADWQVLREELAQRLAAVSLHPPKPAKDIPEPFVQRYFDLMPIHQKLRASEFPTIRNYLKVTACNIHDQLSPRLDRPGIVAALRTAER